MAVKPEILRALERLPLDSLKEVKAFVESLKKHKGKRRATGRSGELLARKQVSAIEKRAGKPLKEGFSGREHDAVLYVNNRRS
jgi:hypothetical protein